MATGTNQDAPIATGPAAANAASHADHWRRLALAAASSIYSQRKRLGAHWRRWAENEVRKRPAEMESELRAELNRLMREANRDYRH